MAKDNLELIELNELKKPSKKNTHDGHRKRVKEKYIRNGVEGFNEHEILELLLFYGYSRRDTNEIAHNLIDEFGGISNLFDSNPLEIMKRTGVSENVAVLLSLTPSLMKVYGESKIKHQHKKFNTSKAVGEYAKSLLADRKYERAYLICLDKQKKLIHPAVISDGSISDINLHTRNVVEVALQNKAQFVILSHNHPSGILSPSKADIDATLILQEAFRFIQIRLLDHIIVAGNDYFSFSENKIMQF